MVFTTTTISRGGIQLKKKKKLLIITQCNSPNYRKTQGEHLHRMTSECPIIPINVIFSLRFDMENKFQHQQQK